MSASDCPNLWLPERLQARCPQAWDLFYREHAEAIWRLAFSRLQDRPAAEDVAGEVFLAAVAGIDRFDPTAGSLTPWLFAIARRRIADRLRLLYRQRRRGTMEPLRDELAERPPADFGLARRVQIALATLPAVQRDVLLWMHQEGLNVRQIADRLGRTQKAAENLLYRARLRFREAYQLSPELESWEPAPPALPFPPPASSRRSP